MYAVRFVVQNVDNNDTSLSRFDTVWLCLVVCVIIDVNGSVLGEDFTIIACNVNYLFSPDLQLGHIRLFNAVERTILCRITFIPFMIYCQGNSNDVCLKNMCCNFFCLPFHHVIPIFFKWL